MSTTARRITVVTAGHLSTCPRMLKAARSLSEAGYRVRVISTHLVPWAAETDSSLASEGFEEWARVSSSIGDRVFRRLARWMWRVTYPLHRDHLPLPIAARAQNSVHAPLLAAICRAPGDLVYGGTSGALAAVARACRLTGTPYALDLEDFHSAEQISSPEADLAHRLIHRIQAEVLPGARFLTTSSQPIAEAYAEAYGVHPSVIHNTFPLPNQAPEPARLPGDGLRLYWFSQTVGPLRGLEDVIRAMGLARLPGELHLRGQVTPRYREQLQALASKQSPRLALSFHPPAPPDRMVELCRPYDVGLALEQGHVLNNRLALSNKALTYILAGLPVVLTDTPGQRKLAEDLGPGAFIYPPGDIGTLATALTRWHEDREALGRARHAAWRASRERWHWEHPAESGRLLAAIREALKPSETRDKHSDEPDREELIP